MQRGLRSRWMGVLFAILITITFGFVFSAVQSNTISGALNTSMEQATGDELAFGLKPLVGALLVAMAGLVIFGGVRRIAHVAQTLVPFMALFYILIGLAAIALNVNQVPAMFGQIVQGALGVEQFAGAAVVRCWWKASVAACSPTRPGWAPPPTPEPRPRSATR